MFMRIKKHIVLSVLFFGAAIMTLAVFLLHPTFFIGRKKIGNVVSFPGKDVRVSIELARDPYAWGKGLMFRNELASDAGMLFVFPKEGRQSFWMKDTLIPLDMLFISKDNRIVTIHKNAAPCTALICPHYTATKNSLYVLEVNAGFVDQHDIREGDAIEIDIE